MPRGGDHDGDGGPNADRPYFFLASCPEDAEQDAVNVAEKYGGFHCIGKAKGNTAKAGQHQVTWKDRIERQFVALKKRSPERRKVFGIAIVGFGACNDEREFLYRLSQQPGHDELVVKQCGDVPDMERWLRSEGYVPQARPTNHVAKEGPWPTAAASPTASPNKGILRSLFAGKPAANGDKSQQGVMLEAIHEVMAEVRDVNPNSIDDLQVAESKLSSTIRSAIDAGVSSADLGDAIARHAELKKCLQAAESRRIGFCGCCLRYCLDVRVFQTTDEERALVKQDMECVRPQEPADESPVKTMLPHAASAGGLPEGTRCCYRSATHGRVPGVVQGFNQHDGTYNLNVRQHACPDRISPAPDVTASEAWPPGTLVEYRSSSTDKWIPAVVVSFSARAHGAEATYDLDVRKGAGCDRMRIRLPP